MFSIKYALKNNIFLILIIIISLVIMFCMFFLNDAVYYVRILELKSFLKEINRVEANIDFLYMVTKYKLCKELYENKIKYQDADKEEIQIEYLLSNFETQNKLTLKKYGKISQPIFFVLNLLRRILNKQPIQEVITNRSTDDLTIAYYFERNKYYKKALSMYDEIIKGNSTTVENRPIVILHQGFCYSVVGDYKNAKEKYLYIIKNYDNENIAITAAILYQYLENFQSEISRIKESDMNSIEKSEQLFKLIAYKDALEVLKKIKTASNNKDENEKIEYLEARCLEEIGQRDDAIKKYEDIIIKNYKSEYSKNSNRRLLIISSTDKNGENLKKLSIKNNELIKDTSFNDILEPSNKVKKEDLNEIINNKGNDYSNDIINDNIFTKLEMNEFIEKSIKVIESKKENLKDNDKDKNKDIKKTINTKNLIVTKKYEDAGNNKSPYTLTYKDKAGTIYRMEQYDKSGKLIYYFIYEYNEKGDPMRIIGFDAEGKEIKNF